MTLVYINIQPSPSLGLVLHNFTSRYQNMSILLDRRRPRPTPLFTTPSTTSTTTLSTTTTTQLADIYHDYNYDYHYYDFSSNSVGEDTNNEDRVDPDQPEIESDSLTGCPGSLRECLDACSPVVNINQAAYKICVNECLERC